MSLRRLTAPAALAGLLISGPAFAHHSFAMFDRGEGKERTISGTLKAFDFVAPHGWIKLAVFEGAGPPVTWSFEMASVGQLQKLGWTPDSVKTGEKVTVVYYPVKFGSYGGQFIQLVLPDGRTLNGLAEPDRGFPTGR